MLRLCVRELAPNDSQLMLSKWLGLAKEESCFLFLNGTCLLMNQMIQMHK